MRDYSTDIRYAGLSNIFYMPTEAIVLEIAYMGRKAMPFPSNYYHEWTHSCNSTHALALAEGEYDGRLTADVPNAVAVLSDAIRASPAHTAACGELPLRHVIGPSAPRVRKGAEIRSVRPIRHRRRRRNETV